MKILFMSGYTADVIAHREVLDDGVNFIQKPSSMRELAVKVKEALSEKSVKRTWPKQQKRFLRIGCAAISQPR